MSDVPHLNFSLNTHFFVVNLSSENPQFLVCHFYCCLTGNAFQHRTEQLRKLGKIIALLPRQVQPNWSLHMPQARDAKQCCSRDHGERALSFQVIINPEIVQVAIVTLIKCHLIWHSISLCPSLPCINVALLVLVCLLIANAGCLSGCLNGQEPVLLVFSCGGC